MEPRESFEKIARFSSLDGLRALAILPVIWHHSTPRPLEGVLGRGPLGVHLFFAISGFLITTLLLREKDRLGQVRLAGFYLRRSLRIFPLYYVVLLAYVIRTGLFFPDSPARDHFFQSLPYYASYTGNWLVNFDVPHPVIFGFSWSLATEEQFYLTFPFVIALSRNWRVPVLFALGAFALDFAVEQGLLGSIFARSGLSERIITSISQPICLGALLAYALHLPTSRRWLGWIFGRTASAPVALIALAVLVGVDGSPLLAIHGAMVALVGSVCLRPDHGLRSVLDWAPLSFVGKVSYGTYLFHVSVITAAKAVLPDALVSAPVLFVVASVVTTAFAAASFRYFEGPLLALRERFRPSAVSALSAR